jgi:hypothetical protein
MDLANKVTAVGPDGSVLWQQAPDPTLLTPLYAADDGSVTVTSTQVSTGQNLIRGVFDANADAWGYTQAYILNNVCQATSCNWGMMRNRTTKAVAALLAVALFVSLIFHVHFVRQGAGQTLLWNKDEAYLFVDVTSFGYRLTYAQYLLEIVKEYFRVVRPSDLRRSSVTIFHITPGNIQRYIADDLSLHPYVPIAGSIYANRQGTVMRWTGSDFEPVASDQQARFFDLIFKAPRELNDLDGWSEREGLSGFDAENKYSLEIGGQPMTLNVKTVRLADELSIELHQPDHPPRQIYYLDQRSHRVSSAEYFRLFGTKLR